MLVFQHANELCQRCDKWDVECLRSGIHNDTSVVIERKMLLDLSRNSCVELCNSYIPPGDEFSACT